MRTKVLSLSSLLLGLAPGALAQESQPSCPAAAAIRASEATDAASCQVAAPDCCQTTSSCEAAAALAPKATRAAAVVARPASAQVDDEAVAILQALGYSAEEPAAASADAQPKSRLVAAPVEGGFLGVSLEKTDGGMRIQTVYQNSAAAKAGLKTGDKIWLQGQDDFMAAMRGKQVGEHVKLKVERDGWVKLMDIELGARPAGAQAPERSEEIEEPESGEVHELHFGAAPEPQTDKKGLKKLFQVRERAAAPKQEKTDKKSEKKTGKKSIKFEKRLQLGEFEGETRNKFFVTPEGGGPGGLIEIEIEGLEGLEGLDRLEFLKDIGVDLGGLPGMVKIGAVAHGDHEHARADEDDDDEHEHAEEHESESRGHIFFRNRGDDHDGDDDDDDDDDDEHEIEARIEIRSDGPGAGQPHFLWKSGEGGDHKGIILNVPGNHDQMLELHEHLRGALGGQVLDRLHFGSEGQNVQLHPEHGDQHAPHELELRRNNGFQFGPDGMQELDQLRRELDQLRQELDSLRGLRQELRQLQQQRDEQRSNPGRGENRGSRRG